MLSPNCSTIPSGIGLFLSLLRAHWRRARSIGYVRAFMGVPGHIHSPTRFLVEYLGSASYDLAFSTVRNGLIAGRLLTNIGHERRCLESVSREFYVFRKCIRKPLGLHISVLDLNPPKLHRVQKFTRMNLIRRPLSRILPLHCTRCTVAS